MQRAPKCDQYCRAERLAVRWRNIEPKPVVVRYEKRRPGELLHLDTKKLGKIKGIGHRITGDRRGSGHGLGWEFLHVCIDDATRMAYAEVLPDEKGVTATGFVERAIAWFRSHDVHVEAVMTDNGSCYRSHRFRSALNRYNGRRLHRGIGNTTPLSRLEALV